MDREELKKRLTSEEYHVTQEKGTETPFQNAYWDMQKEGTYACKVCGQPLFYSNAKIDSSKGPLGLRGWPAFDEAIPGSVEYIRDRSLGMIRTEVVCSKCKAHLGHLFEDSETKTCNHFCANSASLSFKQKDK